MKIDAVRFAGGTLILQTQDAEAKRFVYGFKAGDYDIVPHREKRSNNANSLLWSMVGKIADAVGLSPVEVYRRAVKEVGVYEDEIMEPQKADEKAAWWSSIGLGWFADIVDWEDDMCVLRLWRGSSTYDTKQMSRLLDNVLQDADALEIPTPESERIRTLLEAWDEKKKQ